MVIFLRLTTLYIVQDNYISDVGKVVHIQYLETFQSNTVRIEGKKYIFYSQLNQVNIGDDIYLEAEIYPSENMTRPFGYNQKTYDFGKNIRGRLSVDTIEIVDQHTVIQSVRYQLLRAVNKLESAPFITALWFGENDQLDQSVLSTLNILFLFKVTGLHIYTLLRIIKRFFVKNEKTYEMVYLFIMLFFWYLQHWNITMFRYLLIWLIYQILKFFSIKLHAISIVMISMILQLLLFPFLIFNDGFIIGYSIVFLIRFINPLLPKKGFAYYWIISIHIALLLSFWTHTIYLLSMVLMPVFVVLISGLLFLGSLTVGLFPVIDHIVFRVYEIIINGFQVLQTLSITVYFPKPQGIFALLLLICVLWIVYSKNYQQVIKKSIVFLLIICLSMIDVLAQQNTNVYMLDVGQGDAFIVQSHDCIAVIDAFEGVSETLKGLGVNTIDYLILTHNDLDHTKEKEDLITQFHVKEKITAPFQDIKGFTTIRENRTISCGDVIIKPLMTNIDYGNDNANSLVLKLFIHTYEWLLMADATYETENDLIIKYDDILSSDFLKVGHHGSQTSTSLAFLKKVKPTYALISVGRNNQYGMPHQRVLENLYDLPLFVFRTDVNGTIHFEFTEIEFNVLTYDP